MAIVVIGGQSRSVGKTSVVAGLISALPSYNWTAIKITQFGHGRCSLDGKPCDCATEDRCWAINEERDQAGKSDTSRFLAAGARRSFWVRTEQGRLSEAIPVLQRKIAEAENVIFESNSILGFIQPDLYITVLDSGTQDFKASARSFLDRADAYISHQNLDSQHAVILPRADLRPTFVIRPPEYVTPELVEFVEGRMLSMNALRPS